MNTPVKKWLRTHLPTLFPGLRAADAEERDRTSSKETYRMTAVIRDEAKAHLKATQELIDGLPVISEIHG